MSLDRSNYRTLLINNSCHCYTINDKIFSALSAYATSKNMKNNEETKEKEKNKRIAKNQTNIDNLSAITILKMGFCLLYVFIKVKDLNSKHKFVPFYIKFVYNNGNCY